MSMKIVASRLTAWIVFQIIVLCHSTVPGKTGFLPGSDASVSLFYWLFEESGRETAPLVVWLQGGPGASSLFGAFAENGPFRVEAIDNNVTLVRNEHTWAQHAHMLYIDNPAGTGFSQGRLATNGSMIAADFTTALLAFYESDHGRALRNQSLYITGESFAGHMIPQIATHIARRNRDGPESSFRIPLRGNFILFIHTCILLLVPHDCQNDIRLSFAGIGMGDGWTSPIHQNGAWATVGQSFGLLNAKQATAVNSQYLQCKAAIEAGMYLASLQYCYSNLLAKVTISTPNHTQKRQFNADSCRFVPSQSQGGQVRRGSQRVRCSHGFEES